MSANPPAAPKAARTGPGVPAPLAPLASPLLAALPGVRHAFFTREGGVSAGLYASLNGGVGSRDEPAAVAANRARMAAYLGLAPDRLPALYQVHSADVHAFADPAESSQPAERPRADAAVTAARGLGVSVATADCGPVLFADAAAGVVAAAHAGWKGALAGVIEATVAAMEARGARRDRVVAAVGPMLGPTSYEVGPEFRARFLDDDPANADLFRPGEGDRLLVDLPAYLRRRLAAAGVGAVDDLGLCTLADECRFFSYRRATKAGEPDYGRMIAAIALA